jgi:hypothetical protein
VFDEKAYKKQYYQANKEMFREYAKRGCATTTIQHSLQDQPVLKLVMFRSFRD